jgi:hypothetical protein
VPLPTSQISMSEVSVELGLSATSQISMNDAALRALAGVASGAIGMSSLQGKANAFANTISSNQNNLSLRDYMLANGWNGSSAAAITVASGVTISATSTGSYAMTISGSFPGGLTLINNGAIQGMGGAGGNGGTFTFVNNVIGSTNQDPGAAGGPGLLVQSAVSINNAGRIAGGGGGGAGGQVLLNVKGDNWVGGGGGGGQSGNTNSSGGAGGVNAVSVPPENGGSGTISSAGAGGRGVINATTPPTYSTDPNRGQAAAGGSWGASGGSTVIAGSTPATASGGAGGAAIAGNSNITWIATGTRLGAIT